MVRLCLVYTETFMVLEHTAGDRSTEEIVKPCILKTEYGGQDGGRVATLLATEGKTPRTPLVEMINDERNCTVSRAGGSVGSN